MDKPWKVVLAFSGVFLAGVLAGGAITMRLEHRPRFGGRLPPPPEFLPKMMARLTDRLELTGEQTAKIRPIIAQAQTDFQQLRRQHVKDVAQVMERMHNDVAALLTPEQKVKLDQMRQEFRARAERMRREFRGANPPPPDDGAPPPGPEQPATQPPRAK